MNKKTFILFLVVIALLAGMALPALASGFSYAHPFHGRADLIPHPFKDPGHPTGCHAPLILNENGQCALPGLHTQPDPRPGPQPIGF